MVSSLAEQGERNRKQERKKEYGTIRDEIMLKEGQEIEIKDPHLNEDISKNEKRRSIGVIGLSILIISSGKF